jgi:hypothetical protein
MACTGATSLPAARMLAGGQGAAAQAGQRLRLAAPVAEVAVDAQRPLKVPGRGRAIICRLLDGPELVPDRAVLAGWWRVGAGAGTMLL